MKRHIPNTVTMLNLFAGCMAIAAVAQGELLYASWWILLAAVFDLLDGLLARLLKAGSELGKQLDSLADVVSFGVAPGFILFPQINKAVEMTSMVGLDLSVLPYAAFLIPVFSALRLARFNIDPAQQYDFIGLPTPATALFILSIPIALACPDVVIPWLNALYNDPYVLVGIAVALSILMVSPLHLFSLKFKNLNFRSNLGRLVIIIVGLALFFTFRFASVPFIILLYILLSQLNLNRY